jgi:DNA-binding transcriptional LysR family regulator
MPSLEPSRAPWATKGRVPKPPWPTLTTGTLRVNVDPFLSRLVLAPHLHLIERYPELEIELADVPGRFVVLETPQLSVDIRSGRKAMVAPWQNGRKPSPPPSWLRRRRRRTPGGADQLFRSARPCRCATAPPPPGRKISTANKTA